MNVMETMEQHKVDFTPNDQLIYDHVIKNPEEIVSLTTSLLAEKCGVSQPALSRFVKGLGYARYQDFRTDFVAMLAQQRGRRTGVGGHLDYFSTIYQVLPRLEGLLTDEYLRELAAYVNSFDRVFATGVAKSGQPAFLLEQLMFKTNRFFHAVPADLLGETCDSMGERDLLIIFSLNCRHASFEALDGTDGKILLVTTDGATKQDRFADKRIVLPYAPPNPEESAVSPVMFDMLVELLCGYLVLE